MFNESKLNRNVPFISCPGVKVSSKKLLLVAMVTIVLVSVASQLILRNSTEETADHCSIFGREGALYLAVTFSNDRVIAIASDGDLSFWDSQTCQMLHVSCLTNEFTGGIRCSAFSEDGVQAVCAFANGEFVVVDILGLESRERIRHISEGDLARVALSDLGKRVAVARLFGPVVVWDMRKDRNLFSLPLNDFIRSMAFQHGDDSLLAISCRVGGIEIVNSRLGSVQTTIDIQRGVATNLAFTPDGKELAAIVGHSVQFWNVDNQWIHSSITMRESKREPSCLAVSHDGDCFAVGLSGNVHEAGSIEIWRRKDRTLLRTYKGHVGGVKSIAWSPDSKKLAAIGYKGERIRIWQVEQIRDVGDRFDF